ncbi:MAG: pentapeptide repeat-containing protein [Epibacterium sp.]|nr:pentapeptide repeat-containing protein [Epibacterium sp.]NQX74898.1 pentapeptide repeat-containing protein [Epibacterium sp.]
MEVNGYKIEPEANLRYANLREADLRGTILEGLKL